MIDVFNLVFTTVHTAINAEFQGVDVKQEYIDESAVFPCVTITEGSNVDYRKTMDNFLNPHHARVMYDINVYTNSQTRQTDARKIMSCIDDAMHGMKFVRTMMQNTPNIDRNIYRLTARYESVIEYQKVINGDTVYQVYRK